MPNKILEPYIKLVHFLGNMLGPDYEIALQDVSSRNAGLIAIVNNHISGREIGAPLTDLALKILKDKDYIKSDYQVNYNGLLKNGIIVRSSTYFIKDNDRLIGILCINFDSSRYLNLSKQILSLCHPDDLVQRNYNFNPNPSTLDITENFSSSLADLIHSTLVSSTSGEAIAPSRLTKEERLNIVDILNQKGVFKVKGAINQIASELCCSEATLYRYLNKVSHDND